MLMRCEGCEQAYHVWKILRENVSVGEYRCKLLGINIDIFYWNHIQPDICPLLSKKESRKRRKKYIPQFYLKEENE